MKKKLMTLLLSLALVLSLASCAQGGDDDGNTLTIMGKKSDLGKSYMTKIFELYEDATGNKLDIIAYEDSEYEDMAVKMAASGELPDIFQHFHNADLGRLDVDANFYYLNDEEWVSDLTDGALGYCRDAEGNILGLPFWENSVSGCYYNKTIFDSLGLKPASTQAEFDAICEVLLETGYTPICWPANGCGWMAQFGLDPIFADSPELLSRINSNEVTYSEIPAVADMIRWIADAAESGWFGSDYLDTGWDEISRKMASGDAVMTFIWDTWFYTDLQQNGKYSQDDFALMPVFLGTADGGTYEGGNLNMLMVNKNSERLQMALDFLSFCAEPDNYNAAFDGISTVNCFKGQTTNIQSQMVTDAAASIAENERVSTAASRIVGYSSDDVVKAIEELLRGKTDVAGCVSRLDEYRIDRARQQGTPGF